MIKFVVWGRSCVCSAKRYVLENIGRRPHNGLTYPSVLCETIIDFILENGFIQSVINATREQNALFTNRPSLIESCNTVSGISDHEAVLIKSLVSIMPPKENQSVEQSWYAN